MKKRILGVLLASLMIASLVACGRTDESSSNVGGSQSSEKENTSSVEKNEKGEQTEEIVELQVLSLPANTSGLIEGWWAEEVKQQVGVTINLLPSGDQGEQKLQAFMASGELPDLVVFKDPKQVENALAGKMLLAYDDYKDLLPDFYDTAKIPLSYTAEYMSDETGKAYTVTNSVQLEATRKGNTNCAPLMRYDLYKKIGSPDINKMEDLLPILKQMQELEATNEDGKKVYGFSIWKDWDRAFMTVASFAAKTVGVTNTSEAFLAEIHHNENNVVKSMLAEDSFYLRFLKFYYDANQMGLLDPDSITQRFDEAVSKVGDGRVLLMYDGWGTSNFSTQERENQNIGFARVPMIGEKAVQDMAQPIGGGWSLSVSSATKYPEKAMKFVNYLCSDEGMMFTTNGPKGVIWDVDENNKPYILEEGYEYILDIEKELPGGGALNKGGNQMMFSLFSSNQTVKSYNSPLYRDLWEEPDYAPADTKLVDTWQEDYGAEDLLTYLFKEDAVTVAPFAPRPTLTDEMEQLSARIGDVVKTLSWKMVFAKDDAEFEALKSEMIEKAEGMGIQKFVDWFATEHTNALEFGAKYTD